MGLQSGKGQAEEEAMQMETGQRETDKVETKAMQMKTDQKEEDQVEEEVMQMKTDQKEEDEAEAEVTRMVIEAEAKVIKILSGIIGILCHGHQGWKLP